MPEAASAPESSSAKVRWSSTTRTRGGAGAVAGPPETSPDECSPLENAPVETPVNIARPSTPLPCVTDRVTGDAFPYLDPAVPCRFRLMTSGEEAPCAVTHRDRTVAGDLASFAAYPQLGHPACSPPGPP